MTAGSARGAVPGAERIVPGPTGVLLRDFPFLGYGEEATLHAFLDRAFSVDAVHSVEIDRRRRTGRIRYRTAGDLPDLWRRLGRALRDGVGGETGTDQSESPSEGEAKGSAGALFLDAPGPIRVTRVGGTLSTFRVRTGADDRIRIGHPLLRRRPDLRFRLEEVLAGLPGVQSFRRDRLTAEVLVRLEPRTGPGSRLDAAERLVRAIEGAWPQLLEGPAGLPSATALAISGGILTLSAAGTFVAPALLPVAVAAIAITSLPSVFAMLRDLGKGRIGLPALATTGLVFFLLTRSPLTSSLLATVRNLWPKLAADTAIGSQRRLLAAWRRRPRSAWLALPEGEAVEVPTERLRPGDRVMVRQGETVPADGTVERGLVATVDAAGLFGPADGVSDKEPGDAIRAGERVLDGEAVVRVERPADRSAAALVEAQLPHGLFVRLPALDEAERVANRNVAPTLILALGTLATRRTLRPARGIIRPDYVTAPAVSAQLGAQAAFAEALAAGVLFRHPEALERLARVEVVVLDDSAPLVARPLEVARVASAGLPADALLAWAAVALGPGLSGGAPLRTAGAVRRQAGYATYHDADGRRIEVVSATRLRQSDAGGTAEPRPSQSGVRRSVFVLRDGERLGRIDFRDGRPAAARDVVTALRAALGPVHIVLLSGGARPAADRLGAALGVDLALGGLRPVDKARLIRGLDRRTLWIGDGIASADTIDHDLAAVLAASDVSLSTAAPSEAERADGVLLGGLGSLPGAIAAARRYRAALAADYRLVYATNLAGTMGALAAGLGGFDVGLLTNAGTALVYARHRRRLARLERESAERQRASAHEYVS